MLLSRIAVACAIGHMLSLTQVSGFSVLSQGSLSLYRSTAYTTTRPSSTCIFAEDDNDASEEASAPTPEDEPAVNEITETPKASSSSANEDILNSPVFLKRKLEVLQKDLASVETALEEAQNRLEEGKAEWGPQLDELQKEYQNIQQRLNTQSNSGDNMATVLVARELLSVLDNYDRAFMSVTPETDSDKTIEAEYKEAYDMVLQTFQSLGVELVPTVGLEFDYENHQAVMQKPSDEYEEGIVCEELQKGFRCGDVLVRAAMVVVAA